MHVKHVRGFFQRNPHIDGSFRHLGIPDPEKPIDVRGNRTHEAHFAIAVVRIRPRPRIGCPIGFVGEFVPCAVRNLEVRPAEIGPEFQRRAQPIVMIAGDECQLGVCRDEQETIFDK